MLLTRREVNAQDDPCIRDQEMDFGAEATTGISKRMFRWLRELRRQWSAQAGNFVRRVLGTRCRSTGANDRGIHQPKVVAQAPPLFQILQEMGKDLGPRAIAAPAPEASINSLPATEGPRNVTPRRPGVQAPQDAVEDAMVIFKGSAAATAVSALREEVRDASPLLPRKRVPLAHWKLPGRGLWACQRDSAVR